MKTFEDYLKENHDKHYRGLDDDMPDAYEKWITELDLSTVMELAEEAMKIAVKEDRERIHKWLKGVDCGFCNYGEHVKEIVDDFPLSK